MRIAADQRDELMSRGIAILPQINLRGPTVGNSEQLSLVPQSMTQAAMAT